MYEEILSRVDHTLLKQTAGWPEIQEICDDAVLYGAASVCIPPSFVKRAAEYLDGRMKVCTVIGFPNGLRPRTPSQTAPMRLTWWSIWGM